VTGQRRATGLRRHLGVPAASFTKPRTVGVTELVAVLEDCFPTQPIRRQSTDTAWIWDVR
jgi:hypothetical protein